MPKHKMPPKIGAALVDDDVPLEHRVELLAYLTVNEPERGRKELAKILSSATSGNGKENYTQKLAELKEQLKAFEKGPLRCATFVKMLPAVGSLQRALVLLQDGTAAGVILPDSAIAASLCSGDTVLIEREGKVLVNKGTDLMLTGDEATLERRLDSSRVEVSLRDFGRHIYLVSEDLGRQLDSGEVTTGAMLRVCPMQHFAFEAVPEPEGTSHYKFLSRESVPDVIIERDIGAPPALIEKVCFHVWAELVNPETGRRFRLNRALTCLLIGPTGTGKTFCLEGLIRRIYEIISDLCGVPIEDLPYRVMRLRTSQILNKYVGETDKQIDQFFDEVEELAGEKFVAPDGTEYELPVIVCFEEADSLGRARGEDSIYDRFQNNLLQRLETAYSGLKDKLVIFLFTTNLPELLDPAFFRRAGGIVETFGRLKKQSFAAVLAKQLRGMPFESHNGHDAKRMEEQVVFEVSAWLYSPNGDDKGQVQIQFAHSATPVTFYRRDVVTGGLVAAAVQEACRRARREEVESAAPCGLTSERLISTVDQEVRKVVQRLDVHNAADHLTLPEGARVVNVRRIEQRSALPIQLQIPEWNGDRT